MPWAVAAVTAAITATYAAGDTEKAIRMAKIAAGVFDKDIKKRQAAIERIERRARLREIVSALPIPELVREPSWWPWLALELWLQLWVTIA